MSVEFDSVVKTSPHAGHWHRSVAIAPDINLNRCPSGIADDV